MTKKDKKECEYSGCHIRRSVNIVFYNPDETIANESYYCYKHYPSYVGYMAEYFKKKAPLDMKIEAYDGERLFKG